MVEKILCSRNLNRNIDFTSFFQATLVPGHDRDVLEWVAAINNDYIVLCYLKDVKVHYVYKYYDIPYIMT